MTLAEYKTVDIDKIIIEQAPVDSLQKESLRITGQVQAVKLKPVLDSAGQIKQYKIIEGRRRILAKQQNGDKTVNALIEDLDEQTSKIHSLISNLCRSSNPMHEARLVKELLDEMTQEDLAKAAGVTQGVISQRLSLFKLVDEFQGKLESGDIVVSTARHLIKLPAAEQKKLLSKEKIDIKTAGEALRDYQSRTLDLSSIDVPKTTEADPEETPVEAPVQHFVVKEPTESEVNTEKITFNQWPDFNKDCPTCKGKGVMVVVPEVLENWEKAKAWIKKDEPDISDEQFLIRHDDEIKRWWHDRGYSNETWKDIKPNTYPCGDCNEKLFVYKQRLMQRIARLMKDAALALFDPSNQGKTIDEVIKEMASDFTEDEINKFNTLVKRYNPTSAGNEFTWMVDFQ